MFHKKSCCYLWGTVTAMFSAILVFIVITSWYLNRGKVPYVSMTWCGLLNFAVVAAVVFSGGAKHPVPLGLMALCAMIATLAWQTPILKSQALKHPVRPTWRIAANVSTTVALLAPLPAVWTVWEAYSVATSSRDMATACADGPVDVSIEAVPDGLPLVVAFLVVHVVYTGIVVYFTWFRARRVPEAITAIISVWGSAKIALAAIEPILSVSTFDENCTLPVLILSHLSRAISDAALWLTLVAGVVLLLIAAKDKNQTDEKLKTH